MEKNRLIIRAIVVAKDFVITVMDNSYYENSRYSDFPSDVTFSDEIEELYSAGVAFIFFEFIAYIFTLLIKDNYYSFSAKFLTNFYFCHEMSNAFLQ